MFAAPVDFVIGPARTSKWFPSIDEAEIIPDLPQPADLMRRLVAWIAASTFGRRMLYPGSMAVFHSLMNDQLVEGRRKLLEEKVGEWEGERKETNLGRRTEHSLDRAGEQGGLGFCGQTGSKRARRHFGVSFQSFV